MRLTYLRCLILMVAISLFFQIPGVLFAQQAGPGPGFGVAQTTLTTFETDDFSGSGICAMCHSSLTDEAGIDVSNDTHWRSTMMANAAKDPLWQAKISSEMDRASHLQDVIEEKCSRCHMGMASYQAKTDGTSIGVLTPGFLDPGHYLHEAAMDGVSCTLCHQIRPDGLGKSVSYTGKYVIDTTTSPPNRLIFGPYQDPFGNSMQQASGFNPIFGTQIEASAHCGSCHTLYTPVLDATGDPVPIPGTDPVEYAEFPEQTTYLEWEHAGFSETCQDCHLPQAVGGVVISNRPRRLAPRFPFWQHHFVGGNSYMVNLLMVNADVLGVTAEARQLEDTIFRTRTQLEGDTAGLTVTPELADSQLTITVDVENMAGHKLPSGLPSRRCWLHVVVTDGNGKTLFESGKPTGDGRIEGNDAEDNDPNTWEPHYSVITSPEEVQIYEPIMLNTDEEVTYTLLRAYSYAKDNRLLPAGFNKHSADADIGVNGRALWDTDFRGGSDQIVYRIDIGAVSGTLHVTVKLLFQSVSHPFVADLAVTDTDLVNRFMGMYNPTANTAEVLALDHQTVP